MTDEHSVIPHAEQVPARMVIHPLVERLMEAHPTPEALEKIMALQRDWEQNEAKRAYTQALTELKRDLPPFLTKDQTVDYTTKDGRRVLYNHTSLAGAMEVVLPHLTAHGFSLTWSPGNNAQGAVTVTAKLTHRQGHSEQATLTAPPDMSGSKSAAQGIASTITLLQRYSALAILGLATADMKEPEGEPDPVRVDTTKNMKAVAAIVKAGKTREEAEKLVGRPVAEWAEAELGKLRAWLLPPAPTDTAFDTTKDGALTKGQADAFRALMQEFKLSPAQMGALIEHTFQKKLKSLAELTKDMYAKLVLRFGRLRNGEIELNSSEMEWVEPPAQDDSQ